MVGFGRPGVDLDGVSQRNHQELDPLVLDNLEVYCRREISHIDPAGLALNVVVGAQDLGLEPGEVVHAYAILFPRDGDEDILSLQHFHLLEPAPGDQLIHFT